MDSDILFADWNKDKGYGGTKRNFDVMAVTNRAEYSRTQLGRGAQALIIGCDGIWKTNSRKTVADIIDAFYFKDSNLETLKKDWAVGPEKNSELCRGATRTQKVEKLTIDVLNRDEGRHN